jgi:hypothetical protein
MAGTKLRTRRRGSALRLRYTPGMASARKPPAAEAVTINRAPVLTLWAAVVAERLGYDRDEAATLGKAVAGMNAASKARTLGLAKPAAKPAPGKATARAATPQRVELLGRHVPVMRTAMGLRAANDGKPATPESVHRYLETKFGASLESVRAAMSALAKSIPKPELAERAFALYEQFRPGIPAGVTGWGAKGVLDLARIRALAGKG